MKTAAKVQYKNGHQNDQKSSSELDQELNTAKALVHLIYIWVQLDLGLERHILVKNALCKKS